MIRKYILWLAFFWAHINLVYGQAIGSWQAYPALEIVTANIPAGDKIYVLCNGNLFSYNTQDTEITVYDRVNYLHDSHISYINYCTELDILMVVYSNGNIDLIYPDNSVANLNQLKEKNYSNLQINHVSIYRTNAFLSTNFGIIMVDLEKEEFKNTYNIDQNVKCCMADNEAIYMSTNEGCYKGLFSKNLLDKSNWTRISNFTFDDITLFQNELICLRKNDGLYRLNRNMEYVSIIKDKCSYMTSHSQMVITGSSQNTYLLNTPTTYQKIAGNSQFKNLTYQNGIYWASEEMNGMQAYKLENDSWQAYGSPIQPNSPIRDYFCRMSYTGDRLLVAGGYHNYNNTVYEGTAMYYENNTWSNFSEEGITEATNLKYTDLTAIAQDPNDPTHHFISSTQRGLYEFKDLKFIKKYDYTNSTLRTVLPNVPNPLEYVRCTALVYDKDNNLWMSNNEVDTILNILKADGTWTSLYYPEIAGADVCDMIIFDQKGRLWMTSRRMENAGVFFLDYNGTIENTADDTHYLRTSITNQDGTQYTPDEFYTITEDLSGQLWVGTSSGPFVITNPDEFTDNDFRFEQIKIARNDGTNYADYLLSGIPITAITIDAANRKWLGTSNNGVYLVSADGQEMLQHFTTDNSPLLSNSIQSIAIDPKTGVVMIGTTNGLISYASDANTPSETLEKDLIHAFPNPVRPDYNGLVSVTGLTDNANVKITSVTGQLIYEGTSNGGLFTWNGRTKSGQRVASGVYNVIASTSDGKESVVTRITFIR